MSTDILLVDATPAIVEALASYLEETGYSVASFTDPERALTFLETTKPPLALIDAGLTDSVVAQFIETVQEFHHQTTIILLTDETTQESANKLIGEGVFDCLSKPFDEATLSHGVRMVFRFRQRIDAKDHLISTLLNKVERLEKLVFEQEKRAAALETIRNDVQVARSRIKSLEKQLASSLEADGNTKASMRPPDVILAGDLSPPQNSTDLSSIVLIPVTMVITITSMALVAHEMMNHPSAPPRTMAPFQIVIVPVIVLLFLAALRLTKLTSALLPPNLRSIQTTSGRVERVFIWIARLACCTSVALIGGLVFSFVHPEIWAPFESGIQEMLVLGIVGSTTSMVVTQALLVSKCCRHGPTQIDEKSSAQSRLKTL